MLGGCIASTQTLAKAPQEQVVPVPGFADFIAIDGKTIWVTNAGRRSRWRIRAAR